ncbi:hypothetical protein EPK99_16970 [Neorhizobium lilium]|uniref:Uncharacterized protein n=1 Tax=Neorhizobium lilium TaxID=2503024 RepID=A0A3S3SUY5_9HYPH|nr:hypothetical protein [Neorhizobium lilium]RWX75397.1 hypothetical protein EPK99_16970 [Neorhizobium lilium]
MNSALIVMTILGCNDSGTDCHYIATVNQRWPTVALCDSVSEEQLPTFANQPYPMIIAVCQNPDVAKLPATIPLPQAKPKTQEAAQSTPSTPQGITQPATDVSEEEKQSLAARAIERVRNVLPTTEGVRTLVNKPVRLVEDGYSWVAKRFQP